MRRLAVEAGRTARSNTCLATLVGVNAFLPKDHGGDIVNEIELIRSTEGEKGQQIDNVANCQRLRSALSVGATEVATNGSGLAYIQKTARAAPTSSPP